MRNSFKLALIFVVFMGFQACDQSEDNAPDTSNEEFPDLKIFLDRFETEAKRRGYNFNFSGLDIAYVDEIRLSDNTTYCGIGYNRNPQTGRRTVLISKNPTCGWSSKSDLDRESLFFHELGHAFLNLPHDETKMCNGRYLSMMTEVVNQISLYKENEPELREYYLDELFDRLAANEQCLDFGQILQKIRFFSKMSCLTPFGVSLTIMAITQYQEEFIRIQAPRFWEFLLQEMAKIQAISTNSSKFPISPKAPR